MIKTKKIALALSAIMFLQPAMFAVDSALTKDIVALELELTKMKTRAGEYADLSESALNPEPSMALPVIVTFLVVAVPPVLTPVTTPLLSTVAAFSSLDDHSRVRYVTASGSIS